MISINPLYLLLLVELSCLLAGGMFVLFFKLRKSRFLFQKGLKELSEARHRLDEMQKQLSAARRSPGLSDGGTLHRPTAPPDGKGKELEEARTKLGDAELRLKEKTRLLEQLQAKFDDLEKEYLILYHQQQKQQS